MPLAKFENEGKERTGSRHIFRGRLGEREADASVLSQRQTIDGTASSFEVIKYSEASNVMAGRQTTAK